MSVLFMDSWDHYDTPGIAQKWTTAGTDTAINTTAGVPRTGRGCLQITSAAFGPARVLPYHVLDLMIGTAFWSSSAGGFIIGFSNFDFAGGFDGMMLSLGLTGAGALQVQFHPAGSGFTVGQSADGVFLLNAWNTVAMRAQSSSSSTITVWCNGVEVAQFTGINLFQLGYNLAYFNAVQLMAVGGTPTAYHDDTWGIDCGLSPNDTFPGAVRIYSQVPTADGSPLAWTPSTPPNFQCVDEIPPNITDFVSSALVAAQDQYVYGITSVPAASTILAVQHVMDMNVDTGARSVGSSAGGVTGAGFALTTTYKMYLFPYDTNPVGGSAWELSDFPFQFGPNVTA